MLVGIVHWWPTPAGVGRVLRAASYFMALNILKFSYSLKFIIDMSVALQEFLERDRFDVILSCLKQILNNDGNIETLLAHHLQHLLRCVDFS